MLGAGAPRCAHHAFSAEFDSTRPVTLKGTVTTVEWINPHAWLHMEVKSPDGKMVSWAVEGGAPNALLRRGWNRNSVPLGTEIVVQGYQAKERIEQGKWPGRDTGQRYEVVPWIVGNGGAG